MKKTADNSSFDLLFVGKLLAPRALEILPHHYVTRISEKKMLAYYLIKDRQSRAFIA